MSDTALVQQKVGQSPTDAWSQPLEQALLSYQSQHGITPTGNPDPFTLWAMQIYDPVAGAPSSFQQEVATGKPAGHFGRDLATVTSQVPRWAWITVGLAFAGLSYFAWRRRGRGQ